MAIFAREQSAGKGQRGKKWSSVKGGGIALSIIIDPRPLLISQQFHLSACVAVAAREFFARYAGPGVTIKWPNDIYWNDKKAGGILIESGIGSKADNRWIWAIAGIGLNINQNSFAPDLPNPVSLHQVTGQTYDTAELARALCAEVDAQFRLLLTKGFKPIHKQYLDHLYKKGQAVQLKKENRVFEAVIKTVQPGGQLVVQHGVEEEYSFGEVEWVIR